MADFNLNDYRRPEKKELTREDLPSIVRYEFKAPPHNYMGMFLVLLVMLAGMFTILGDAGRKVEGQLLHQLEHAFSLSTH